MDPRIRGDDGLALNSASDSNFTNFFTRSFAGMTPNHWQISAKLALTREQRPTGCKCHRANIAVIKFDGLCARPGPWPPGELPLF
jgi:hypothetical protein